MLLSFETLKKLESTSIRYLSVYYSRNLDSAKGCSVTIQMSYLFGYGTNFDGTEGMAQI